MSDDSYLSPELRSTLEFIKSEQRKLDSILAPAKQKHIEMQAILSNSNYYETMRNINSIVAPAIEVVNQYKAIIDSVTKNIPIFSEASQSLLSEVEVNISEAISMDSFPDEISSFQINDQDFNNEFQKSVSAEIISNVHEEYQKTSKNVIDKGNNTNGKDEMVEHSNLRSDLSSKEWHSRMWVEGIYGLIILKLFSLSEGAISDIQLQEIFKAISHFINHLR